MRNEVIKLYEDNDKVTLTTYVLDDSKEMLKGRKRPAILICPGGAYIDLSDREAEPVALRFAAMGYHCFVLHYSVYSRGKFDMGKLTKRNATCVHPRPMLDIAKAMLLIRERAEEWKVDVEQIGLCGFSAGAHNVAMYMTNWHREIITKHYGKEKGAFRPALAILAYVVSDYAYMAKETDGCGEWQKELFKCMDMALLGEREPSDEMLKMASPVLWVDENTPPVFLWATAKDNMVPIQHTLRMAHALADHDVPFEVHVFEQGPHGMSLGTQASAGSTAQISSDVQKWTELAEAWLQKRLILEIDPPMPSMA